MTSLVFWSSVCFVGYAYAGYPILLGALYYVFRRRAPAIPSTPPESIAIVIACRNEASGIRKKIEDTLQLQYGERRVADELQREHARVQCIIASDASDDETNEIARSFVSAGVKLVALPERGGKERAQIAALKHVQSDIVLFTDARITLEKAALVRFLQHFSDTRVAAVSACDEVVDASGRSGEGGYVGYEMYLRHLESSVGSLVGMSGSCFAVRRELTTSFPVDMSSDFAMSLEAAKRGLRSIHAADIKNIYAATSTPTYEFQRKSRTVLRGIRVLMSYAQLMNPWRYGFFSLQLISHKLLRWLVPFFLLAAYSASAALTFEAPLYAAACVAGSLLLGIVTAAFFKEELQRRALFRYPLFFFLSNLAIVYAWYLYLTGVKQVSWNPTKRS